MSNRSVRNTGVIFWRMLRDSRNAILAWGIGVALISFFIVLLYPQMSQFEQYQQLLETDWARIFIGEGIDFATPEGFFSMYVLVFSPLYLSPYLVILGLSITAGEEERGTADILFSAPVPRWRVVTEKVLSGLVILALITLIIFAGSVAGIVITPEFELSLGSLLQGMVGMWLVMIFMTVMSLLFATLLRSRNMAGGVAGAVIAASYLLTNLSALAQDALRNIKYASFYTYYNPNRLMLDGLDVANVTVLVVAILVLFGGALLAFQRRDLAV
ncbi:MAG: ABC transporter permease subunit [Anaerolineae bacterium]|nr:ABC transporter permease subunit [Anaerolineae bacterium]